MTGEYNILFTSVGRRVSLIKHFQKTLRALGLRGRVVGVDVLENSPAFHIVDKAYKICQIDDPSYIPSLLEICRKEHIKLLFPLIDTDLAILSENKKAFRSVGTNPVISDPEVIKIARNKYNTYNFFVSHGIDTPKVFDIETVIKDECNVNYPLFIKPMDGNASRGIFKINGRRELLFFKDYVPKPILQEYIEGTEHTLDILFDFEGRVRCVVPRKRIEVRAGEVSKGMIVDDEKVISEGWHVGECLRGGVGCINTQCFLTPEGKVKFVEINPRFGGGVPLSLSAHADFPRWIIEMARGKDPGDVRNLHKKGMVMLRYDEAVFLDGIPSRKEEVMVFGAGGHAKVVIDAIEKEAKYVVSSVLDDQMSGEKQIFDYKIDGGVEQLQKIIDKGITHGVVAVGDNFVRGHHAKVLEEAGFNLIKVIHPEAVVSNNVNIGDGTVVFAKAVINSGTQVGKNCIINTGAIIEHDNVIEDNVHISPRVVLGGNICVGKNSHIGIGAVIINRLNIGNNTIIGAGSVVTRDIPDNVVAYGIPAKIQRKNER